MSGNEWIASVELYVGVRGGGFIRAYYEAPKFTVTIGTKRILSAHQLRNL